MSELRYPKLIEMPPERQFEIRAKGGRKSGETKRRRKALKEELEILLAKGDTQERVSLALIEQALNGNVKAYETIRSTLGEDAPQKIESTSTVINISIDDGDDKSDTE